jgi:hypothetical protein
MWKVGDVARVDVRGREAESTMGSTSPTTGASRSSRLPMALEAEAAATHVRAAIKLAVEVQPHALA